MSKIDLDIVVASRGRAHLMPQLLELLPTAKVFVDEREEESYAKFVPKPQLFLHRPTETCCQMRKLQFTDPRFSNMFVSIDDDLKAVRCMVGKRVGTISDPSAIRRILENTAQSAKDLGSQLFCFTRRPHPGIFRPFDPFCITGICAGAWGQTARPRILPDLRLQNQEDLDCTLQSLLEHRIVFQDCRFYFDFGGVGTDKGGNQISRTSEREQSDQAYLEKKWAGHLDLGVRKPIAGKSGGGRKMSVLVTRRSKLVDLH